MTATLTLTTADGVTAVQIATQDGRVLYRGHLVASITRLPDGQQLLIHLDPTDHAFETRVARAEARAELAEGRVRRALAALERCALLVEASWSRRNL